MGRGSKEQGALERRVRILLRLGFAIVGRDMYRWVRVHRNLDSPSYHNRLILVGKIFLFHFQLQQQLGIAPHTWYSAVGADP